MKGKLLTVVLGIEELIDQVCVAKTQMPAVGKQLRLSTVYMLQLSITGSAISCTP